MSRRPALLPSNSIFSIVRIVLHTTWEGASCCLGVGWLAGWWCGWLDGGVDGWLDGWLDGWMADWMAEWMAG
jgi:hypothetical protein